MTRRLVLSLIEDYIDGHLGESDSALVREYIETDPVCRAEYEETIALKELLKNQPRPDPGWEYWREVTELIHARTVETSAGVVEQSKASPVNGRMSFVRSLASAVASVFILISALYLGASQRSVPPPMVVSETAEPVFLSSSLAGMLGGDRTDIITRGDQLRLSRGLFLLGPPGILGRSADIPVTLALR